MTTPDYARAIALIAITALFLPAACDSAGEKAALDTIQTVDTSDPPQLTRVITTVTPAMLDAGGQFSVACAGEDQYGAAFDAQLTYTVVDAGGQANPAGVTVAGASVTVIHAGVYRVRCLFDGTPRVEDLSPVDVTVLAGAPASISTALFLTSLTAGDTAAVGCIVKDANGNAAAADTTVQVGPTQAGVAVTGRSVRFTTAGTYAVVCALVDGSIVGTDPVTVTVSPAKLKTLTTALNPDTIQPGEPVTITCEGADAFGNAVPLDKVFTLPIDGVDWLNDTRLLVTATRTGSYPIACAPKEAWVKVIADPQTLTVLPGPPSELGLVISPDKPVYDVGAKIRLTPTLTDAWGNAVPEVGDTLTTDVRKDGTTVATVAAGELGELAEEGPYQLRVATGPPANLTHTRTVLADGSAPIITITYPPRGGQIATNGQAITITGTISDPTGGLASVKYNGAPQTVTDGQTSWPIAIPFTPLHGLNSFTLEATDKNGQRTRTATSFIATSSYKPVNGDFPDGILAHLTKDFVDDRLRSASHDDLATLFLAVLEGFDVAALIPSPVVTYAGYDVFMENLSYGKMELYLTPSNGQLAVEILIPNLSVDIDADGFIDVSGTVSADAIHVDMVVLLDVSGGVATATTGATVIEFDQLDIDVHWSINWLIDLFTDRIKEAIGEAFADALKQQIPPVLADALTGLALDQGFDMPAFLPGMEPVSIDLGATPDDVSLSAAGIDLDLKTKVTTQRRVPWSAPGSIERGGCFGTDNSRPGFSASKRISFALSLDVLNRILFSVWWAGALEIELPASQFGDLSSYGVSDLAVTLSGRLPPILTDCNTNVIELQLGELDIDASLKLNSLQLAVGMVIAFKTEATIGANADGEIDLSVGAIDVNDVVIDIVSVDSDLFDENDEDLLITLLREQLLGGLLEGLAGNSLAGFPLPEIDLGTISDDLAGTTISINGVEVRREHGYLVLEGNP